MNKRDLRLPLLAAAFILLVGAALVVALVPAVDGPAQTLVIARLQTALSMAWHIAIACFGTGMPLLLLWADARARRGAPAAEQLLRLWNHSFAVLFAVGAVSGTLLSFTLGMLWPGLFARYGDVFGIPFAFEGLAFFTEAIALGFWMYARGRISGAAHRFCGWVLALSGVASAVFVVCANGWMNAPAGFTEVGGVITDVRPVQVIFNAAALPEAVHMVLAALLVTAWAVAGAHALALLRRPTSVLHRSALSLAAALACVLTPVQLVSGDLLTRFIATEEPAKFAAAEAHFATGPQAPLALGGVVIDGTLRGAVEIPSGLSLLLHGDAATPVAGLDSVPRADWPAVGTVHIAFQLMVLCGSALLLLTLLHALAAWKRRALGPRVLRLTTCAGVLALMATECGWMVTEIGRQPWLVRGHLRTAEAVTTQAGLLPGLLVLIFLFALLSGALVHALRTVALHEGRDA